ncbi:hypothetical protein A33Q_0889 [Indibacter alkaliphilus LW1]|uniref:Uncharacterized protein n=1 Tax=Indibacter alkaliphilus (strain CCUG 57479 / KCTC 22604 / LW1) TaxID=1189612 RepID=S2E333_INDAL|nr:hypothetical protein A33Q_0889 [Indibacter alkaliphilus LW1]
MILDFWQVALNQLFFYLLNPFDKVNNNFVIIFWVFVLLVVTNCYISNVN